MTTTQPHNPTTTGRPVRVGGDAHDPFATIPGAYDDYTPPATKPAAQTPAVVVPTYFIAEDGFGNVALWRGTGTDDDTCQTVAYRYTLDAMDTALWPTLVAALVEGGAR